MTVDLRAQTTANEPTDRRLHARRNDDSKIDEQKRIKRRIASVGKRALMI